MKGTKCANQFYSYALFVSWTIVFFAVLAIFYSFMETGMLFPPAPTPQPNHVFKWMEIIGEPKIEAITDMTYKDNKKLEQNIANLNDPIYQIALNALHVQEMSQRNGLPNPGLYYLEP